MENDKYDRKFFQYKKFDSEKEMMYFGNKFCILREKKQIVMGIDDPYR